jgi:hypothetical protein
MTPTERFQSVITVATMLVMFVGVVLGAPYLRELESKAPAAIALALTSFGLYRLLAITFAWLLKKWLWLRSLLLGSSYLRGTWVGYFVGHAGDWRYVVEHFQQDLYSLVVTGRSFTHTGEAHAHWISDATTIDAGRGRLIYTYTCDVLSRVVTYQGVAVLQFERPTEDSAPVAMAGYVADLVDGTRLAVHEEKLDSTFLPWTAALQTAMERFPAPSRPTP